MRILNVGLGGVTREFRNWPERIHATALAWRGHHVVAYGFLDPANPLLATAEERIDGVLVRRLPRRHWPTPELWRALDRDGPFDVVHMEHPRNVLAYGVARWCRAHNVPIVYTWLGPFHDRYLIDDREQPYAERPKYERLIFTKREILRRVLMRASEPRTENQEPSAQSPRSVLGSRFSVLPSSVLGSRFSVLPSSVLSSRFSVLPKTILDHYRNYWLHWPLAQATALLPCSHHEEGILRQMGLAQPSTVVPLWIDVPYIEALAADADALDRELPDLNLRSPTVLYVGQLTRRKCYDLMVAAMPAVVAQHPDVTFLFVTHNPEQQAHLLSLAAEQGVADHLRFLGRLSDAALFALYRAVDVFAYPSRYEGFGLPTLEAMAAGCPLVTTDIPVIDEVVRHGENGWLVRYNDAADLGAGICTLLGDPALRERLVAGGLATVRERFAEDTLVAQIEQVFERARTLTTDDGR